VQKILKYWLGEILGALKVRLLCMVNQMTDETIDLFIQHEDEMANQFWEEVEQKAAHYEVTVDYYLAEFM